MTTSRLIDVTLSANTLARLRARDAVLLVIKGVWTNSPLAVPVVWRAVDLAPSMRIGWTPRLRAWTRPASGHDPVRMHTALDVDLGDRFEVRSPGFAHVIAGQMGHAVELYNPGATERQGGLAQEIDGALAPICALPLLGGNLVDIEPLDTVALAFASRNWAAGSLIDALPDDGVLLESVSHARVRWAPRHGWSVVGAAAVPLPASTRLQPLLAGPPASDEALRKAGVIVPIR